MVRQCLKNDFNTAKGLLFKMLEGFDLLFVENNPAGVKAVLAELGIIENHLRLPLVPLSEIHHQKVREYLEALR